jgi:hypothetical protein
MNSTETKRINKKNISEKFQFQDKVERASESAVVSGKTLCARETDTVKTGLLKHHL